MVEEISEEEKQAVVKSRVTAFLECALDYLEISYS